MKTKLLLILVMGISFVPSTFAGNSSAEYHAGRHTGEQPSLMGDPDAAAGVYCKSGLANYKVTTEESRVASRSGHSSISAR
jgi:hypothetical protein